ncbi:pilus assembly protein [Caulobacter sp. 17J80-11]|nr:pilus assembly protein [Caulobacter sp. 17J80-11]
MSAMHPFARLRRLAADRSGASLVEFTLVAPLLISLMCGLAEFGLAFRQYHVMEKGVRDAARYLSRTSTSACSVAAYQAALATWPNPTSVPASVSAVNCDLGGARGKAVVTVTASRLYQDIGLLTVIGVSAPTLTVTHQQLVIGS